MKPGFGLKINLQNVTREPIVIAAAAEKVAPVSGETIPGKTNDANKDVVVGISERLRVGFADTVGARDTMEDKTVVYGSFRNKKDEDYFAVFDGHSGTAASIFASKHLHKIVERRLNGIDRSDPPSVMSCLHESFMDCQEEMRAAKVDCGTTALVSLWLGNDFYLANAGDCRAVACINKREKRLTVDHKPLLPSEKSRILKHKGAFLDLKGRIQGRLSCARALGDFLLVPYVCCEPEVFGPFSFGLQQTHTRSLHHKDYAFIIFACDGLWDVVPDRKAVKIVKQYKTPKEAACALRDRAVKLRSKDNISVVVIFFPGYVPGTFSFSSSTESQSSEESESESESSSDSGSGEESGSESDSDSDSGSSGSSGSGSSDSSCSGSSGSKSGSSSGSESGSGLSQPASSGRGSGSDSESQSESSSEKQSNGKGKKKESKK